MTGSWDAARTEVGSRLVVVPAQPHRRFPSKISVTPPAQTRCHTLTCLATTSSAPLKLVLGSAGHAEGEIFASRGCPPSQTALPEHARIHTPVTRLPVRLHWLTRTPPMHRTLRHSTPFESPPTQLSRPCEGREPKAAPPSVPLPNIVRQLPARIGQLSDELLEVQPLAVGDEADVVLAGRRLEHVMSTDRTVTISPRTR